MNLHPIDRLEISLSRRGTSVGALPDVLQIDDVPTAAEYIGVLWFWRQRTNCSGLGTTDARAVREFLRLARGFEMIIPELADIQTSGDAGKNHCGVIQLPPLGSNEWLPGGSVLTFQERFRAALRVTSISREFSYALTGALGEMASNAVEHADSPASPIASFEVTSSTWSFGVTDVGRGALASLRENPEFSCLEGETEALDTVLREGVSRFAQPGRGHGFSHVFKSLVDRRASLRFRSGGASTAWEGHSPTAQVIHSRGLPVSRSGFHVRIAGPTR